VTGRALVFSNPEVVGLAGGQFVPYAGDKWYLGRQQDGDGAFMRKVCAQQAGAGAQGPAVPQGIFIATADGRLLGADHFHPDPARMVRLLRNALASGGAGEPVELASAAGEPDRSYARTPPEGGLILKVFSRIPLDNPGGRWTPNDATGRDHLWLTHDEWRSLIPARWETGLRYAVPRAISERLVRFHLVDNIRGEPPLWTRDEIRTQDLALVVEDAAAADCDWKDARICKARTALGGTIPGSRVSWSMTAPATASAGPTCSPGAKRGVKVRLPAAPPRAAFPC
jgi:hypothetical protein